MEVAEKQRLVVECVSHHLLISVVQCGDSEVVNSVFHVMFARKVSLVTML
jgi:hypothetical protein